MGDFITFGLLVVSETLLGSSQRVGCSLHSCFFSITAHKDSSKNSFNMFFFTLRLWGVLGNP